MDKEKLDLELEIDGILSEFSHKEAAGAPRKVSDNTLNMLLDDILGHQTEKGKSTESPAKPAERKAASQKVPAKPTADTDGTDTAARGAKDKKLSEKALQESDSVFTTPSAGSKRPSFDGQTEVFTPPKRADGPTSADSFKVGGNREKPLSDGGFTVKQGAQPLRPEPARPISQKAATKKTVGIKLTEISSAAGQSAPSREAEISSDRPGGRQAERRAKLSSEPDPLESGRTDMETIPTWEERHSPEYLKNNPDDPINKIRSMNGMKASSAFLDDLKQKGGVEREKREVIYRKKDKFFSKKISFDTKKSRTVFEGLEKIGENEWQAADGQTPPLSEGSYETDGEYHRFSESADIRRDLEYQKKSAKAETVITFLAAAVLIFLSFSHSSGSSLKLFYDNPKAFALTNAIVFGVAVLANIRTVFGGIASLFRGKIIPGTVASAATVPTLIYNIILIFKYDSLGDGIYSRLFSAAAVLCLLFVIMGRNASLDLRMSNFELVGNREEKYPLVSFFRTKEAEELGRGLSVGDSKICLAAKCDDVSDFMYHSFAEDPCIKSGKLLFCGSIVFSLICALLCYFYPVGGGKGEILSCYGVFCGVLCLTQPALLSLSGNALFRRSAEKLKRDRIMLSGYDAVEEFSDANILAIDASELFPEGSVVLKGLKASENRMLDYSIIDAAKILEMAGGPLSPLFSKIMQNDTGFDPKVDTIIYEEEMGISGWVSGQRVLVGNRKLLELHGVRAPDYGYEQQYEGTGIRPVYLANEGKLTAIFLVQYKASRKIAEGLREAVKRGISIAVYSCDPNITAPLLCRLFRLPAGSIRIMGSAARGIYKKTAKKSKTPLDGTLLCDGEARSILRSVAVCKRMKKTLNFARALLVIMCFLGAVLAVGIVSSAGAGGLTVKLVCAFLAISFAVVRLLPTPGA